MIDFNELAADMIVYDVHKRAGGPKLGYDLGCWKVRITSVDKRARTICASWNGQKPTTWTEERWSKLHMAPTPEYLEQRRKRETSIINKNRIHDWGREDRRTRG